MLCPSNTRNVMMPSQAPAGRHAARRPMRHQARLVPQRPPGWSRPSRPSSSAMTNPQPLSCGPSRSLRNSNAYTRVFAGQDTSVVSLKYENRLCTWLRCHTMLPPMSAISRPPDAACGFHRSIVHKRYTRNIMMPSQAPAGRHAARRPTRHQARLVPQRPPGWSRPSSHLQNSQARSAFPESPA